MRVFENGTLIVYNVQRSDAGYYMCQASNGIGAGLSKVIKMTVKGKQNLDLVSNIYHVSVTSIDILTCDNQ